MLPSEIVREGMTELQKQERIPVKDVRSTDKAAELIASTRQTYVEDHHIFPVCCTTLYSVIVNYKCRVMNLLAKAIYPADSCSPGAKATRACAEATCWI